MGGTAVLIWGTVDAEGTARRGFFARLLGRGSPPREVDIGRNRKLIDLPAESFQALVPEFKDYIRRRTGQPWPATQSILDYLDIAFNVRVRGEREGDSPPSFYVQMTFGGCAGMADISSEIAAHWASRWFGEERQRIVGMLSQRGFTPTHGGELQDELTYLPVGDLGYAAFRLTADDDEDEESGPFELDAAITEDNDAQADALLRLLTEKWASFMADGRCHCQFCDPGFDQARLAVDVPMR